MFERSICYNNLWKLMIDRKISHSDLRLAVGIAYSTMGKMKRDEVVSLEVLLKICTHLDCDVGDVLSFVKTEIAVPEEPIKPGPPKSKRRVSRK